MPGCSGGPVVTNARVYYTPRAAAGASGARHSPRPRFSWADGSCKTRANHAAGLQTCISPSLRGALATKQSSFLFRGAKAGLLRGACHRATRSLSSGAHSRDPLAPTRWLAMTVLGGAFARTTKKMVLLRINLRINIAQDILLHLAHGVAGQFVDHDYPFRHLEFCQPPIERLQHRGLVDLRALVADQHRGDALAEIGMRHADHGGFDHARHGLDLRFQFLRINIEAAGDHEILAAADDMHVTFGVDLADIAGDQETVVAKFGFCLFRHPPVALEDIRALDLDHTDAVARNLLAGCRIGDSHLHARPRVADRARDALA